MWGLDMYGSTWKWTDYRYEQVQGQLRQISVSYDGQVWGVNFKYVEIIIFCSSLSLIVLKKLFVFII
jgi:hypothetical protein